MGMENINKGIRFDKMGALQVYGATSATADLDLVEKPISPLGKNRKHVCLKEGEGVYLGTDGVVSEGFSLPVAEAVFEAHAATEIIVRRLSATLVVAVFLDGNDTYAKAIAGTIATSGVITWGTAANVNAALSDSLGLCRVSDTSFAVSYRDNTGTTGYCCIKMGSVATTTITMGTEVELTAAAVKAYTDVAVGRSGVLVVVYSQDADSDGYSVAIDYTGIVLGTAGTAVEFNNADTSYQRIVSHVSGSFVVTFRDAGNSNYACGIVGTVSAAKVIAYAGSVTALNAAAATFIKPAVINETTIAAVYIAATYATLVAVAVADEVLTPGTVVALNSSATKTPDLTVLDQNHLLVVYEDDGAAVDYGRYNYCSRTDANVVASVKEYLFAIGATSDTSVAAVSEDTVVIAFADDGDSNKGKALVGFYNNHLIDVRSSAASKRFILWLLPNLGQTRTS